MTCDILKCNVTSAVIVNTITPHDGVSIFTNQYTRAISADLVVFVDSLRIVSNGEPYHRVPTC